MPHGRAGKTAHSVQRWPRPRPMTVPWTRPKPAQAFTSSKLASRAVHQQWGTGALEHRHREDKAINSRNACQAVSQEDKARVMPVTGKSITDLELKQKCRLKG